MFRFSWLPFTVLLILLILPAAPVYAQGPSGEIQENPQNARQVFSSIALLQYYSSSLDYMVQLDAAGNRDNLEMMPFANVPVQLESVTSDFAQNGESFGDSLAALFGLWDQQKEYMQQYRLDDAVALYRQIVQSLPLARQQLNRIQSSVVATGQYMKIDMFPLTDTLKVIYEEVLSKVQKLGAMLDLLNQPLVSEQQAEQLTPVGLDLAVSPTAAYVGDSVTFQGDLSTNGGAMVGKQITLAVDNAVTMTVETDSIGHFRGEIQVPCRYVPVMMLQALYYPAGSDAGKYLAGVSPSVKVNVLYYDAKIEMVPPGPAYPGKDWSLAGTFNYGDAPAPAARKIEIYLDDNPVDGETVEPRFNQNVTLSNHTVLGRHVIEVLAPADGRYDPVSDRFTLDVIQAATVLEMNTPDISIIPGNLEVSGRLYSNFGPLGNAGVSIGIGSQTIRVISQPDGTFIARMRPAVGFNLLGNQAVKISVQPAEPWNAPISDDKDLFFINALTTGILLAIVVITGIFLPRKFRRWFKGIQNRHGVFMTMPRAATLPAGPLPPDGAKHVKANGEDAGGGSAKTNPVYFWYRLSLGLVQNVTKSVMKPQNTIREYARNAGQKLGPAGKLFIELTYLREKQLYAGDSVSREDVNRSGQLAGELQSELKKRDNLT